MVLATLSAEPWATNAAGRAGLPRGPTPRHNFRSHGERRGHGHRRRVSDSVRQIDLEVDEAAFDVCDAGEIDAVENPRSARRVFRNLRCREWTPRRFAAVAIGDMRGVAADRLIGAIAGGGEAEVSRREKKRTAPVG